MSLLQCVATDDICARGSIKDSDVARLRRAFYEDGCISPGEADRLFELDHACAIKDPAWADFFVEAITDYIVNQARPEGYVVATNATWLIDRISSNSRVESRTGLELLVNVLEKARWAPPSLAEFALGQVKQAVMTGSGPLRAGQPADAGAISPSDVALLRRILFAFGGDGSLAVTRAEADALIDINHVLRRGGSVPEFTELFVKAVANAALHGLGLAVPSRAEALREETWAEEADMRGAGGLLADAFSGTSQGASARGRVGGFLGRMVSSVAGVWGTYRQQSSEERALARLERQRLEIITSEPIADADAAWLAGRLRADGLLDENEAALLAFLKSESPILPSVLQRLIDHGCRVD